MLKLYKQYKYLVFLQFMWHCVDVVERGVTFWPTRCMAVIRQRYRARTVGQTTYGTCMLR